MTSVRAGVVPVAAIAAALTLIGCGGGSSAPPASGSSSVAAPASSGSTPSASTTSESTVQTPTTASTSTAALPTDCATLATEPTRLATVGDLTLQSDGAGFARPEPSGATLTLGCDWILGDSTGALLLMSTAEPDAVTTAAQGLPAVGYTCQATEDFAAQFCVLPGANADTEEMVVARDNVWIYLSTSNRNARAFLSEIVEGTFG